MEFKAVPEIGPYQRLDFDRAAIRAIAALAGIEGYLIIDKKHTIIKIVGEILPTKYLGENLNEVIGVPNHPKMVESVDEGGAESKATHNRFRDMADSKVLTGNLRDGEPYKLRLAVGPIDVTEWAGCRIAISMGGDDAESD